MFNVVDAKGNLIAEGYETEADAEAFVSGQLGEGSKAKVVEAATPAEPEA